MYMPSAKGPQHTDIITENCSVSLSQNGSIAEVIGKKFEDFSSLEIAIEQYQKEGNVQFFRRSSRTFEKAQPRMPDKKIVNI